MTVKKPPVLQLPAEQQALLTGMMPELRRMARNAHYRLRRHQDLCEAEDLLQDALLSMLTARVYPPADVLQLTRWAYIALSRRAHDNIVSRGKEREGGLGFTQELAFYNLVPETGEEKVSYLLRMARLHLRPVVNQVLISYGQGQSGQQIAATLGIPHATVRTHFHVAKQWLRRLDLTAF